MMIKPLLAALACGVLALSACGGASAPANSTAAPQNTAQQTTQAAEPASTQAQEPAQSSEPAPQAPAGDFPFEEGPIDIAVWGQMYKKAMTSVKTMTMTSTNSSGEGDAVITVDNSDPANPRSHSVSKVAGQTIETVAIGSKSWVKQGDAWVDSGIDGSAFSGQEFTNPEKAFKSVTLVDKAARQFAVEVNMGIDGSAIPATLWLDEDFRASKMEISYQGIQSKTEYGKYNEPVEIPQVG